MGWAIYTASPYWSVWLRKIRHSVILENSMYTTSWPSTDSHLSAIKATHWSPWCWGKFLYDTYGYFQNSFLSFMGLSPLSFFSELYFMVEVCWSITQNQQYCKWQKIFLDEQKHVKKFVCAFVPFSLTSPVKHIQIIKMKFLKFMALVKSSGLKKS